MPADLPFDIPPWLIGAWLFVLGAAVGSFLNVVIYRLPRGMSLLRPGSHCPACQRPIRWFDNIPILSWLMLRGRCRGCRSRISPRYPLVEATAAGLFLLLGVVECLASGAADTAAWFGPADRKYFVRPIAFPDMVLFVRWPREALCAVYLYHLLLLCTLLCGEWMDYLGQRPPRRLFVPVLLAGVLAPLAWPYLRPAVAFGGGQLWLAGAVEGGLGLALGLAAGWPIGWLSGRRNSFMPAAACVGLLLGWRAVGVILLATCVVYGPVWLLRRWLPTFRLIPPAAWLALATLAWMLWWNLSGLPWGDLVHWAWRRFGF